MTDSVLHAVLTKAEDFKTICAAAAQVIEDGTFMATPKGITTRMMDASHVALLDAYLDATKFEEYKIDSNLVFGIRVDVINKVLKHIPDDDKITLDIDRATIRITHKSNKYKIATLTPDEQSKMPRFDPEAEITIPGDQFGRMLDRISIVDWAIKFTVGVASDTIPATMTLSSKGDSGTVDIAVPGEEFKGIIISNKTTDIVQSAYSIEYVTPLVKLLKKGCTIKFAANKPLLIESTDGLIRYYMAPRIEV